jgi:hypothetical protein
MSINLDRSRESLDHSICSIPTREVENIIQDTLLSPILSSPNYNNKKLIEERDFDLNQMDNNANGTSTIGIGDTLSKKQSEK